MTLAVLDASAALALALPDEAATAQRRGRLTPSRARRIADLIDRLDVRLERPAPVSELSSMAFALGLSAYDAAYLQLAERQGCPLITGDAHLAGIARAQGVTVLSVL